jgi:hypothetical protein
MPFDSSGFSPYKNTPETAPQVTEELEELEIDLSDPSHFGELLNQVEGDLLDRWYEEGIGDDFTNTEAYTLLQTLKEKLTELEDKEEITDADVDEIQTLCDSIAQASLDEIEESEEPFDPSAYIQEQFSAHPYLIPSQRSPVYLLEREYKRAVAEGVTDDAQQLAEQIKQHVDELTGNDDIAVEGVGVDLERPRQGVRLTPEDLDGAELEQTSHIKITKTESASESETLELYGMKLPSAGDKFRFGAITFRDGLKLAMRHDPELQQLPGKQALFGEMLKLLEYVPEDGISVETEARLRELATQINDPEFAIEQVSEQSDLSESEPQKQTTIVLDATEIPSPTQLEADLATLGARIDDSTVYHQDTNAKNAVPSTPEYDLQQVMRDVGQTSLEPDVISEHLDPDTKNTSQPPRFTPKSVTESATSRAEVRQQKQYEEMVKNEVKKIEKISSGFFSRIVNGGESPYKYLADEDFEGLVMHSQTPYVDSTQRQVFMRYLEREGVSQSAFEEWMKLLPEIEERGIDTAGKTFKQVVDALIADRLASGNTQSA